MPPRCQSASWASAAARARINFRTIAAAGALLSGLASASPSHAALTLTSAGVADGFGLSTVVSGFSGAYGPLAEAILPDGNFITGSYATGSLYVFKDVDGQTLSSAVSAIPYTNQTANPQYVMATVGGQAYGAQVAGGSFVRFANDGSSSPIPGLVGVTAYYGMWGDAVDNHLIASSNAGIIDIDPLTGIYRVVSANVMPDGLTVSTDGTTIYAAVGGNINAYAMATGALIQSYSGNGHGADGTGVISSAGSLNGKVIVNNNDGTVALLDPATGIETIIASGGTRGDFVSPDSNNGTLFISQYEQVARLSCGANCTIGSVVPEPSTYALFVLGLLLVGARRQAMA